MGNGVSCFYPEGRELLRVAESGDVAEVKGALHADIALTRYRTLTMGNTAWHKAAKAGRLEVLMEMTTMLEAALLSQGKAVEGKDPARVLWRLGASSKQVVARLLNQRNHRGQTPLMLACGEGHDGCTRFLAEHGADPFLADKLRGQTCLHYAALAGHEAVIRELLKAVDDPARPGAVPKRCAAGLAAAAGLRLPPGCRCRRAAAAAGPLGGARPLPPGRAGPAGAPRRRRSPPCAPAAGSWPPATCRA
jgi:hypothetical protein